jgi:hypothetical protein
MQLFMHFLPIHIVKYGAVLSAELALTRILPAFDFCSTQVLCFAPPNVFVDRRWHGLRLFPGFPFVSYKPASATTQHGMPCFAKGGSAFISSFLTAADGIRRT